MMEFGTVTFFDGRNGKRFGFIKAEKDGEKVFFHSNNQLRLRPANDEHYDGSDPVWEAIPRHMIIILKKWPREGQRVIFERSEAPKGPEAKKWCFEKDANYFWDNEKTRKLTSLLQMAVTWDIIEITFVDREFPANSLFGDMENRTRPLQKSALIMPLSQELLSTSYRYGDSKWGYWGPGRTFKFKVFRNTDTQKLIDITVGQGIVENITYDDLTRIRHARHWRLPDTATIEQILKKRQDAIDEMLS